jgi:hypothetical protein
LAPPKKELEDEYMLATHVERTKTDGKYGKYGIGRKTE